MTKQEYIKVCENFLQEPAKSKMIEQINLFFDLANITLKNEIYAAGENVVLKKNTFLHGFGNSKLLLDKYASEGLISKDFELGKIDKKISYCVSLWHIHKKIVLADYIKAYSGMTFFWGKDKCKIVPYGQLDKTIESLKKRKLFFNESGNNNGISFFAKFAKGRNIAKKR